MPEACTKPSYPIILSFNFEVNIITKLLYLLCECSMQGWQHFRQVVLRMWSPTCQQWRVSQAEPGSRDRLGLPGTHWHWSPVAWAPHRWHPRHHTRIVTTDIPRGQTCDTQGSVRAPVTSDGGRCHRCYRSHTPTNYWAYCCSYCILMFCKSIVRRDSLIFPCQIQKVIAH